MTKFFSFILMFLFYFSVQAEMVKENIPNKPTSGIIKKIDGNKLVIKHERIEHLDMPAMTMVFRMDQFLKNKNAQEVVNVRDDLLKALNTQQEIVFDTDHQFNITEIKIKS